MKFINPYFLFALSAIIIPIIIHLFNFRRFKKVYFTNVRFLNEVKIETQKKSKLKHLLTLISRILAISCLVFAFAQPYIPVNKEIISQNKKAISVYIDNSFSMNASSGKGILLDDAKNKAKEIIDAHKQSDEIQIITNDFDSKFQRFLSKDESLELIKEINVSNSNKNLSEIVKKQKELFINANIIDKNIYILSDLQSNICDFNKFQVDTNTNIFIIPLKSSFNKNIYIDTIIFDAPSKRLYQTVNITVRIKNCSDDDVSDNSLKLTINGIQRAISNFSVQKNSFTNVELKYTINDLGINAGILSIDDDDINFDNTFYFSYNIKKSINILCINQDKTNYYLNKLFDSDSSFNYTDINVKNIDYSELSKQNLIVLNGIDNISTGLASEIVKFVSNGGNLLVIPSLNIDINSYTNLFNSFKMNSFAMIDTSKTKISKINETNEIYRNVFEKIPENADLPIILKHFKLSKNTNTSEEWILKTENNECIINSASFKEGKIYVSTISFDKEWGNFAKHIIFVPTIYNIALYSEFRTKEFYTIDNDNEIILNNFKLSGDETIKITNKNNTFDFIPEIKSIDFKTVLNIHNQINKADVYYLKNSDLVFEAIAFNYNRKESEMKFYDIDNIKESAKKYNLPITIIKSENKKPFSQVLNELNRGISLWKWFILFALIFLAIEILLLRFFK